MSECEHESLVEQDGHHQRDIQNYESDRACKNKPHPSWPILQSPLFDRQANKPETIAQLVENRVYHTWHSTRPVLEFVNSMVGRLHYNFEVAWSDLHL